MRSVICGLVLLFAACSGPATVSGMALIGELLTTIAQTIEPHVKALQADCVEVSGRVLDDEQRRSVRGSCAELNDAYSYLARMKASAEVAQESGDRYVIDQAAVDLDRAVHEIEEVLPVTSDVLQDAR